ncbi:MAG TPA: AarF/ABC1/UbiB kinase family protein [Nitrospiria bacterium]
MSNLSLHGRMIHILYLTFNILFSYQFHFIFFFFTHSEKRRVRLSQLHRRKAQQLRETALKLKGVLVKIGQFMSTRVDLLPPEYTQELALLQDQVPPQDFPGIANRIQIELGKDISHTFSRFNEEPIAAASLGQVHEAWLMDGRHVAVKVQYLGIEEIVKTDLKAIRWVTLILQWRFKKVRFNLLYNEFSRLLKEELNYIQEGRNADHFGKNFKDDPRIIVPRVIWEHTTSHVLTLEFVDGVKINDLDGLMAQGMDTKSIAQLLVECYMKQILQHHFFHGDPHPGNIFVQPGPCLVFVDFGLVQKITPSIDKAIKQTVMAIIQRDTEAIIQGLMDLGFIVRTENPSDLEQVASYFMEKYRDMSPREFREITVAHVAEDLSKLLRVHSFLQIPNHFILFARTAGMLNGINMGLNPDLNMVELAKPFAQEYIKGENDWVENILIQGKDWGSTLYHLPRQLEDFLKQARRGEFKTKMTSEDVTGILGKIYKLGLRLVLGLMAFLFLLLPTITHDLFSQQFQNLLGLMGMILLIPITFSLIMDLFKKS